MYKMPVYEAKNRFSELLAAVERGDEVSITRRGVTVARLVAAAVEPALISESERITAAFARLRQIRDEPTLEGDLRVLAREGLD